MACNPPIKTTRLLKCLQCEHSSRIEGQKVHTQLHTFVEVTLIAGRLNGSHQFVQFGALWVCCIGWRLKHRDKLLKKQKGKQLHYLLPIHHFKIHQSISDPMIYFRKNTIDKILTLCQFVQSICIANRSFRTICHKPEFGNVVHKANYQINLEHALLLRHSNPRKLTRLLCGTHHLSSLGTHVLRFPPVNLQNVGQSGGTNRLSHIGKMFSISCFKMNKTSAINQSASPFVKEVWHILPTVAHSKYFNCLNSRLIVFRSTVEFCALLWKKKWRLLELLLEKGSWFVYCKRSLHQTVLKVYTKAAEEEVMKYSTALLYHLRVEKLND
ncbi:hypothetical protein EGR_09811 [Echinococcus granulosus]|uniref:Uncharacterized protein n=1 Tax=Echinococcus granulosus TaxID=6210 RepID=W6U2P0_ECHGR|nr:hypothetical protein EGR_09811 [Echinococcus granulosus]EUB55343.1 hypothetical protein EGR_09811 [Echinococcus granulosus]